MTTAVAGPPINTPNIAPPIPPLSVIPTAALAAITNDNVSRTCPVHDIARRCRLKTGNRPKTSMEKSVRLKTWVVDLRREASTVEAMRAAFVESEAGNFAAAEDPDEVVFFSPVL